MEEQHYIGCCGLYCGLCPRFQSTAPSRCLGCHLGEQHSYCSVYRCCVVKQGLHTCADCEDYACGRLRRVIGEDADSFISHQPAFPNLERIREVGLDRFLAEQQERRLLAQELLEAYNEGRSMTLICTACALLSPEEIRSARRQADGTLPEGDLAPADRKARAKALRAALAEQAERSGVSLKLRKGKG